MKNGQPNWDDAPEWANWRAQDANGEWWWYEHKPMHSKLGNPIWDVGEDTNRSESAGFRECPENWQTTLEQRP